MAKIEIFKAGEISFRILNNWEILDALCGMDPQMLGLSPPRALTKTRSWALLLL